jgi:hypothetical protein
MSKGEQVYFHVSMEYAPNLSYCVGDTVQVTTDGGLRIFLKTKLVGAVRAGQWKACVLRPRTLPQLEAPK